MQFQTQSLATRIQLLESEARLCQTYREELDSFEQLQAQNTKLMEAMEVKLEQRTQQLALNTEQMKLMHDKDIEYEKMLEYWTEIHRANYVYVATKNDEIDKKLADYINKSDLAKKSKCLFVREQEGVYSYFFKKVIMKVEENNLIIRVGGGFMSLDDFIEVNNPFEQSRKLIS